MSWFRPAALYLTLTALIAGSIWLFWGKAIEQKWKQLSLEAAKPETKKNKLAEKKIPLKPDLEKKKTELVKISPRKEWQKTQSGIIALIDIEAADNRQQLLKLGEYIDNRWYALLRRPKPAAVIPPGNEQAKPEGEKPAKLRQSTSAERRPSTQKAK